MTERTITLQTTLIYAVGGGLSLILIGYLGGESAQQIEHSTFWYCAGMLNAYLFAQKR